MGIASAIEWTDATWNPWQGCTKISPACEHCYMFTDMKRYGRDGSIVVRSKPPTFNLPLKQKRTGEHAIAPGSKVFTCSWSDWFHQRADEWRGAAWEIIRQRPDVTFQIVTKRTDRIATCLPSGWGDGWPNVWLIATVENQEYADRRIPELLSVPAVVHGLSIEPMLGAIKLDLLRLDSGNPAQCSCGHGHGFTRCPNTGGISPTCHHCDCKSFKRRSGSWKGIDWIIAGGESGPGARPMHPQWVRGIRDQCVRAEVPFFFKQWGDWLPSGCDGRSAVGETHHNMTDEPWRIGKKLAGRTLDGQEWSQFPQIERVVA